MNRFRERSVAWLFPESMVLQRAYMGNIDFITRQMQAAKTQCFLDCKVWKRRQTTRIETAKKIKRFTLWQSTKSIGSSPHREAELVIHVSRTSVFAVGDIQIELNKAEFHKGSRSQVEPRYEVV